jgi:hypothetical protein
MKYRLSILLLALAFGISGGALFAQEEVKEAPPALDPDAEAPLEEVPLEEAPPEEVTKTKIIEEKRDVLTMPETPAAPAAPMTLPWHGLKMEEVERRFGTPNSREPAVGQPPITRWNYDGFSVFFEHRTVLHAVQKDRPAPISHKDELLPADSR